MKRGFSKEQGRILGLSSLGGILEFYDFIIFVFFASYISKLFFPPDLDSFWATLNTYGTFAAGYFARPLGGIIMAHFGDKKGRKNVFMLSIILMVIPTFALGLMPTFELIGYAAPIVLIIVRIMQGIAIGGELPGAWVFISEHAPKKHMYFSVSVLTSAVVGGILLGSIVTLVVKSLYSDELISAYAWRIPFILGGIFGLVSIYLRRFLSETPVFKQMQKEASLESLPLKKVLKNHKIDSIFSALVSWVLTGCIVVLVLLMPNFMPDIMTKNGLEISRLNIIYMQMACIFMICFGCFVYGALCDKIGVSKASSIFAILLALSVFTYFYLLKTSQSLTPILIFYLITGFFASLGPAGAPNYMIALFESKIRFSAISFSYNIAYAIAGGITPPMAVAFVYKYDMIYLGYYMVFLALLSLICQIWFSKYRRDVNA